MVKVAVGTIDQFPPGEMRAVKVDGKKLLVYHLEDGFYATQSQCTHLLASLARGKIVNACEVRCPLHRARFDIRSGEVLEWANFPPGVQLLNFVRGEKALQTYPVSVEGGSVYIECQG